MLIKYSFVLRLIVKVILLMVIIYLVQLGIGRSSSFGQGWYWWFLIATGLVILEDKIGIEKRHTLIILPTKSDLSAFAWIENEGFEMLHKKKNKRIYVKRASQWYLRNDFIRISLLSKNLKIKMRNELATQFEKDFYAHIQEALNT